MQIIETVFQSFQQSLRSSSPTKNWLKEKKIDHKKIAVGYDTGKHHRAQEEEYIKNCLKNNILEINGTKGYRSFAKGKVIFPLLDKQNQIINLFAQPVQGIETGYYLKEDLGYYPKYPDLETRHLVFAENIKDGAIALSKQNQIKCSLLALDEGIFSDRHKEALMQLVSIQKIEFTPFFNTIIKEQIKDFIENHIGGVEYIETDDLEIKKEEVTSVTSPPIINWYNKKFTGSLAFVNLGNKGSMLNTLDNLLEKEQHKTTSSFFRSEFLNKYQTNLWQDGIEILEGLSMSNDLKCVCLIKEKVENLNNKSEFRI